MIHAILSNPLSWVVLGCGFVGAVLSLFLFKDKASTEISIPTPGGTSPQPPAPTLSPIDRRTVHIANLLSMADYLPPDCEPHVDAILLALRKKPQQ